MRKPLTLFWIMFFILFSLPSISAAHFVVGYVNNALDGTGANGKTVILWNPANGINDNLTDIVGPTGNSGSDKIYMIDCELLNAPCLVGDEIRVKIINNSDNYISDYINITITGSGFDVMSNLTLNSPPVFANITVDDSFSSPVGEIDLTPATTTKVTCGGIIYEYDGNESLMNVTSEFFDNSLSFYGDNNDNNLHYSNSSCSLNLSYGNKTEASFNCGFQVEYYANSGNWNCTVKATDNLSISKTNSNKTKINTLLAIGVPSPTDYGKINATSVSPEFTINVTNYGNAIINLSLNGYAGTIGDGYAMNCSKGAIKNISVMYEKYNLTKSNLGIMNLTNFEGNYTNLTSNVKVNNFNLNFRQNDTLNEAVNSTYWRVYVPLGVAGSCSGNIVFGAVQSLAN